MKKIFAMALAALSFSAYALKVGDNVPDFTLKDGANVEHKLSDHKDQYVVLEWLNHGCPFVKKHYGAGNMQALQKEFTGKNVVWYSVESSAKGSDNYLSPADTLKAQKEHNSVATAVLLDSDSKVAQLYGAKTTPHMFIIGPADKAHPNGQLLYNGAIDDKATTDQADIAKATPLFKNAMEAALGKRAIASASNKPYGCGVKYKN